MGSDSRIREIFRSIWRWFNPRDEFGRPWSEVDRLRKKFDAEREASKHLMHPESLYEELELEFMAMSDDMADKESMDGQMASWMSMRPMSSRGG